MPPNVRRQYEFAMGLVAGKDGIPDILQGEDTAVKAENGNLINSNILSALTTTRILVNGQEYSRWEDVPATIRDVIEKAAGPRGKAALETSAPPPGSANLPVQPISATGLRIGGAGLSLLILAAILLGMVIAWKALR